MKTILLSAIALSSAFFTSKAQGAEWEHFSEFSCELPSNAVTAIQKNDSGVWVGTEDGLAHFDGTAWTVFNTDNSPIPSDQIQDVHVDALGAVWVATYQGLAVYRNRIWQVYTSENSLIPDEHLRAVTTDQNGNVWIGTWGGGLLKFFGEVWTVYDTYNSELPNNGVFTVEVDELNRVWAGTFAGGVAMLEAGVWTVFNTDNSDLPNNNVRSIVFGQDHSAWIGTENGLAHLTMDGEVIWQVFTSLYFGHSVHIVANGTRDANGTLWFATDGGLIRCTESGFNISHMENSDIASDNATAVAVDNAGNVFVGLAHHGLSVYNPNGVALALEPTKTQMNMDVWPNPTTDELRLRTSLKGTDVADIIITDLAGRNVTPAARVQLSGDMTAQHTVDVSALPVGTYMVVLQTQQGSTARSFVKL